MENFVLYEEIGKGEQSIIYKGRRKGTIQFLAIHCVEKTKRAEVTNQVRLTHEIQHENIVQFQEWYETSNHLWLVLELCNGGSLAQVVEQDGALPESCVRQFALDLCEGLHAIHCLGLVFSDLRPSKILLDGSGHLKYADFGLSRVEGENLEELLQAFGNQDNDNTQEDDESGPHTPEQKFKTYNKGSPHYMAPEVIQGGAHTMPSDLWSLGCVIYELFTGHPPFENASYTELVNKIIHSDLPPPSVKGARLSGKPSPDLVDFLKGLLDKDPAERYNWESIFMHPFFQGKLSHLSLDQDLSASRADMMRSTTPLTKRASSNLLEHARTGSVLGHIKDLELRNSIDRPISALAAENCGDGDMVRPLSRQSEGQNPIFTISSRPGTSQSTRKADVLPITHSPPPSDVNVDEIIYYTSDWLTSAITDNPKIQKPALLKYDPKSLPMSPTTVAKLIGLPKKDKEKHLSTVSDALSTVEKGPPTQKRVHLLTYATVLAGNEELAQFMVARDLIALLIKQLKDAQHVDLRSKIARLIGVMACNCQTVADSISLTEPITQITDMIRENFRNVKLKSVLVPTLGEILFLISRIEDQSNREGSPWTIPSLTFTMLLKCVKEGEDTLTHHYAAKCIENILATTSYASTKLTSNEIGQALWYLFTHSTVDSPRITALSALCRITKKSVSVFESVVEKVGFPNLLSLISTTGSSRIQQAMVTMLCEAVSRGQHRSKYQQHKELFTTALHLLESASHVVRAKAFVLLYIMIREDNERLLSLCQSRLIMYIERDKKKQHIAEKPEQQNQVQYLSVCLNILLTEITRRVPPIIGELLELMDSISGRKHPSGAQAKQLKHLMAVIQLITFLLSSSVFRPRVVDDPFLISLASLIQHAVKVDCGETGVTAAGTAGLSREEFVHSILCVVEIIMQHPPLIAQYQAIITGDIAMSLAQLCLSASGESKLLSLKLFCELANVFVNTECLTMSQKKSALQVANLVKFELLPQYEQILMDLNPIPSYGLKLLSSIIELDVGFAKELICCAVVPDLLHVIEENHGNPLSHVLQHGVNVLNSLVHSKDIDLSYLYQQGLVEHLVAVMNKVVFYLKDKTEQSDIHLACMTLTSTLETAQQLLKHVSDVVRQALQAQKSGDQAGTELAEESLLLNKPFTTVISVLPAMVSFDDPQISELTLKVLSLLVQLFGGENKDSLDTENLTPSLAAGPMAAFLVDITNHRFACMLGATMMSLAHAFTAYTNSIELTFVMYGIVAGTSACLLVVPCSVFPAYYFEKRKLLAISITLVFPAAALMILPATIDYVLQNYGWIETHLLCASLAIQGLLFAALLRPPPTKPEAQKIEVINDLSDEERSLIAEDTSELSEQFNKEHSKLTCHQKCTTLFYFFDRWYAAYVLQQFCFGFGSATFYVLVVGLALENGLLQYEAAMLCTVCGISGLIGRVVLTLLGNFHNFDKVVAMFICQMLCSVSMFLYTVVHGYTAHLIVSVFYGFGFGCSYVISIPVLIQIHPSGPVDRPYGCAMLIHGIGILIGPPISALLYKFTGSYLQGFGMAAAINSLAVLAFLPHMILLIHRKLRTLLSNHERHTRDPKSYYNEALRTGDAKRQKFILRILKRLITTDRGHLQSLKGQGSEVMTTLNKLSKTASTNADAGLTSMAAEIQRIVQAG